MIYRNGTSWLTAKEKGKSVYWCYVDYWPTIGVLDIRGFEWQRNVSTPCLSWFLSLRNFRSALLAAVMPS